MASLHSPDPRESTTGSANELDFELPRGRIVGRFVVLSQLGRGGMGVVYSAWDPEIGRHVALKFHHGRGEIETARLLREARALGRISHPNVVAIHDVGTDGERVWLAMEYVEGQTLEAWLAAAGGRRPWPEVIEVMQAAGRGLIAVHEANLVHRDLTASNIMIAGEGRVRVMDFGIVRGDVDANESTLDELAVAESTTLTRTGKTVGTPAYMAPEQFRGVQVDARSDQFSFCVVLWRALYGERPFPGESVLELRHAVLHGRRRPPPRDRDVPVWLREIVERGLATNPDDRWPSIDAVLAALASGRRRVAVRRTIRRALIGLTALAGVAIGIVAYGYWDEAQRVAACTSEGARIDELWNDEQRERIREGMIATGVGYAETMAPKVVELLDRQAEAWRSARTETCLDVEVRERWDAELDTRARWCLDQRWDDFELLIEGLGDPDKATVQRAVEVAYRGVLASSVTDPCRDEVRLALTPLPPTERRESVRDVRAALTRAELLARTGKYDDGLAAAREALVEAEALDWPPLTALARYQVGSLSSYAGEAEAARDNLTESYFEAAAVGASQQAAASATLLVFVLTEDLDRLIDARHWARLADVELRHMGEGEDQLLRAALHQYVGGIDLRESNLSAAKREMAAAIEIRGAVLGTEHPSTAISIGALALVHYYAKEFDQAAALYAKELEVVEAALGPEHPKLGALSDQYAVVLMDGGSPELAKPLLERSLDLLERNLGPDHPDVANALINLGIANAKLGDGQAALVLLTRAEQILTELLGPESLPLSLVLANVAQVKQTNGELDEAWAIGVRMLAMRRAVTESNDVELVPALAQVAELAWLRGEPDRALELANEGLSILVSSQAPAERVGPIRFIVAKASWALAEAEGDLEGRRQALALAEQAAGELRGAASQAKALAEIEAWIAARR
ncbi:serine/threonine-protein kinase [Nannocystaceae bacterium ST9]